jgi:hypothetical protein
MLEWESLAETLDRLVRAGAEIETAKKEICDHIAQDLIRTRVLPAGGSYFFTGKMALQIPPLLKPADLDWKQSRPKQEWNIDPRRSYRWEKREISLVQLSISDIEFHLCESRRTSANSGLAVDLPKNRTDDFGAGRRSRKVGKPAIEPDQHRQDIEAVISLAKSEYPPPKSASLSFAEMAKQLKGLQKTQRYGWSAISQILRGTYPKMIELDIKSPYGHKRA